MKRIFTVRIVLLRMIAEVTSGKKGGDFRLPFGGNITVPAGTMGKKDVVTCCMTSPSDRFKYQPPLRYIRFILFIINMSVMST